MSTTAANTDPTFRVGPAEQITDVHGRTVTRRLCEEFTGGRWESFYSYNVGDLDD